MTLWQIQFQSQLVRFRITTLAVAVLGFLLVTNQSLAGNWTLMEGSIKHDFGEVRRHQTLSHRVVLKNSSEKTMQLTDVQSSCGGCSPLNLSTRTAPPQGLVTITTKFKSGGLEDPKKRTFYITDSTGHNITLVFTWKIKASLPCSPESIRFGKKNFQSPRNFTISFDTAGIQQEVQITSASCNSKHIRLDPPQRHGSVLTQPFTLLQTAPAGDFQDILSIQTNYPLDPRFEIPITGEIVGPFIPEKPYIKLKMTKGITEKSHFIIHTTTPTEKILSAQCESAILDVNIKKTQRRQYSLILTPNSNLSVGKHTTTVHIKTSCEIQPLIEILALLTIIPNGSNK